MAQTPAPRVDVPSRDEFDALAARVTVLEADVADLDGRVTALEGGNPEPIPPEPVPPDPSPGTGLQALRIADVIGIFGVNTFSSLDDGNMWGSWPADYRPEQVINALRYLTGDNTGHAIRIREYHYAGRETMQRPWLEQIKAAVPNTTVAMCVAANGSTNEVPSMLSMADLLVWTEGLNEPNTDFGSGQVPVEQTMDIQNRLFAEGADKLVVMGPSIVAGMPHPEGWVTGYFGDRMAECNSLLHRGNGHYYPPHCSDLVGDGTSLPEYIGGLWTAYGEHLIDLTEYHPSLYNNEGNGPSNSGWDGNRDAYYTLLALLRSSKIGVMGLWWYALFDYGEVYKCGLFPTNATNPRPAADALRRLCQTCLDPSDTARSFAPGKCDVQVGCPPNCDYHLAQASNGTFMLFIWHSENEPGGDARPVTLTFAQRTGLTMVDLLSGKRDELAPETDFVIDLPATVRVLLVG